MTSFKDARNLLLESYNDGIIDDDEFILLYEGNFSKNPEFLYEDYERFDLNAMDENLQSILDLNSIFLSELLNFTYIDLVFFAVVFARASMMTTETQPNTQSIHL